MADELNFDIAMEMAQALSTIPEFPRFAGAIRATAEDLVRWCKGAIIDRRHWSAEAQAADLVCDAREKWTSWQGTAALYSLFREKFVKPQEHRPPVVLSYEETLARGLIRPPCTRCDDSGYVGKVPGVQFCNCRQGRHQAKWEGERGLLRINTPPVERKVSGSLRPFTPITEADMQRALDDELLRKAEQLQRLRLD
jgi:hypothetical protein